MRAFIENMDLTNGRLNQNVQIRKILQFLLQEGDKSIPEIRDYSRLSFADDDKIGQ